MQAAWTWLGQNWLTVALVALGLVQVINKATDRWDISASSKGKRLLLLLTELLSFVTSKDFRGTLGLFKMPLNPYGGRPKALKPKPVFPPGPTSLLSVLLVGCVLLDVGCATTSDWEKDTHAALKGIKIVSAGAARTVMAVYDAKCQEHILTCNRDRTAAQMCEEYKACKAKRAEFVTAFRGVLIMVAEAADLLRLYEVRRKELRAIDSAELRQIRASVDEKKDRAIQRNGALRQDIAKEGIVIK